MARITMRNAQKVTFAQVFELYISAVTARGVKDKTISTYKQHFHAISKRLDASLSINRLNSTVLEKMILRMRSEGLSDSSINSYTRTLKCFLSWCNEEVYTDEELLTLLKKPEANCKFCEYWDWVIVKYSNSRGVERTSIHAFRYTFIRTTTMLSPARKRRPRPSQPSWRVNPSRSAVSIGGDCDTLTCIAGSVAEGFYGVKDECRKRLPRSLQEILARVKQR